MINARIVDLSHALYPGQEEYHLNLRTHNTVDLYPQYPVDEGEWYILQDIDMSSHCGTHIEFPYHHNRHGMDAGTFPLARLIGDCVLLDFRHKESGDLVTLEEVRSYDSVIRAGDMLPVRLRLCENYRTDHAHDRPAVSHDADEVARLLKAHRSHRIGRYWDRAQGGAKPAEPSAVDG